MILFQNRDPKSWIGGDQKQLEATRSALEGLGVETKFSSEYIADPTDILDADIVHCFNFSMPWTKYQIWNAKKLKKKVVCSMVYHETEEFVSYKFQQAMVNDVDQCIFLTKGEIDRARRHLIIPDNKIHLVPNGIDPWWFEQPEVSHETDVLTVGRIDKNKGQLAVAEACQKLGLKYTVIGEWSDYANKLIKAGAVVKDPMDREELKKWYAGCKVYALVSEAEVMPLTVMEAMAQDKPIVLTSSCEWEVPTVRANYGDVNSIEAALTEALIFPMPNYRPYLPSWDLVASMIKDIYEL